jgi:hypothetical protein
LRSTPDQSSGLPRPVKSVELDTSHQYKSMKSYYIKLVEQDKLTEIVTNITHFWYVNDRSIEDPTIRTSGESTVVAIWIDSLIPLYRILHSYEFYNNYHGTDLFRRLDSIHKFGFDNNSIPASDITPMTYPTRSPTANPSMSTMTSPSQSNPRRTTK